MRLDGYRMDGAVRLSVVEGLTIVLKDGRASPPLDDREADRLGPWLMPDFLLTSDDRRELYAALDLARVVPVRSLVIRLDKDEHGYGSDPKDGGGRSEGELAREAARHKSEDVRSQMAKSKAERGAWTPGPSAGVTTAEPKKGFFGKLKEKVKAGAKAALDSAAAAGDALNEARAEEDAEFKRANSGGPKATFAGKGRFTIK